MCGFTGRINFNLQQNINEALLRKANQAISHRGPDDDGIYLKQNVGLAHRRLSIIDLSPSGHQPMSNKEKSVWLIFNGEIYNFLDLRTDLQKKGYSFVSKTDTEVIIYLYEAYGEECFKLLRGMFSLALWDDRKKKLLLARDRSGKKPLKYYVGKDFIVFGSELKSFLNYPDVPRRVDLEAINHYLTLQYVPSPKTGFKDIKKLPPAHYLSLDLSKGNPEIKIQAYWEMTYQYPLKLSIPEWKEKILHILEESVRLRMIADVPLGAFLSGGLDSSAIVAMMAKHSPQPIKTFSIGFHEKDYNELPYAQKVADQFSTDHTEFIVKPDALKILPKLVTAYEEPYADSSAIPTWYLSELTRQQVTVALNGDGGDENFAGYGMFPIHQFAENYYGRIPSWIRNKIIISGIKTFHNLRKNNFSERCLRFATSFEKQPNDLRYLYYISYFTPEQKQDLYKSVMKQELATSQSTENLFLKLCEQSHSQNVVDRALYFNFRSYLPDDLLVKVDIATMAFGLEGRSPLLDHHFLELSAQIPWDLKIKKGETKYIFKKALEGILSPEIIYRKKKGFGVPLEHWFRNEFRDYAKEVLLNDHAKIHQWLRREAIASLLEEHLVTQINHANKLWALLTLELWMQNYL
ncbi:MAG: asparagine synthetase [glutamine-hydrolyzing] 1, asparagine synthase (glutamine-hydrolysing) [Candidatus Peregrinibacteria bacterium GW2011_GWF2_39_17]|nr:MAG: asparagine synthetase [glutamine-hydrolyzing] 1, asparagine synthase (glutamine-hydrolysing) [Candidatus Peregrinibacteria bacterium GW2011_GWF2_39_17]HCW32581.1 asparagine synthase (glutamine-hydrolyzing) [Candidatus Peregrinibacteria bacterium]